jgi:hypothetical protein
MTEEKPKGTTQVEVLPTGISKKVIATSIIIPMVIIPLSILGYGPTRRDNFFDALSGIFFLLIAFNVIAVRLNKLWKLTPQEMVLLYIPLQLSCWYGVGIHFLPTATWPMYREPARTQVLGFFPEWLTVKELNLIQGAFIGRSPVPWSAWTVPLISWFALLASFFMLNWFLTQLIRKPVIEIDRMPFPRMAYVSEIIARGTTFDSSTPSIFSWAKSKWLWIGFIFGAFYGLPAFIAFVAPVPTVFLGYYTFNLSDIMWKYLPGAMWNHDWDSWTFVYSFFAPLDVLASLVTIWVLFAFVLSPLGYALGLLPDPHADGLWSYWNYAPLLKPGYWGAGLYSSGGGLWWALGILPFIFWRRHIIDTIKSAMGKIRLPEEAHSFSYRTVWIGFLVFIIILTGFFTAIGCPVILSFIIVLMYIVWMVACANVTSEIGFVGLYTDIGLSSWTYPMGQALGLWGEPPQPIQAVWAQNYVGALCVNRQRGTPIATYAQLEPYFLASQNERKLGVRQQTRTISLFILGVGLLAIAIALPWTIFSNYSQGMDNIQTGATFIWRSGPASATRARNYSNTWTYLVPTDWIADRGYQILGLGIGFALAFIVYYLRSIFPWFYLHPVGMFVPWWVSLWGPSAMTAAFIIKALILRIGGVKVYENYAVPAFSGFALGYYLLPSVANISLAWPTKVIPVLFG